MANIIKLTELMSKVKEVRKAELEELPGYEFNVVNDLATPYKLDKDLNGKWYVAMSSNIEIANNIITCNESTFTKLQEDKEELNKFKEFLIDNK